MKKVFGEDYFELSKVLNPLRDDGKKVVMCSGTFDLLHLGHMRLLAAAKTHGDILVAVVKSDNAATLKKEDPPVLNQVIRMETVSCVESVDFVIMADYDIRRMVDFKFENSSAFQWLNMFSPVVEAVRPDIFVHEDNPFLVDARRQLFDRYGVHGVIQPRTEGISTTEIIDKIKTRLLQQMQR
ncbi:MAG: adenylyltransferase/cytidyltransferase family protein [Clostridia bacterium]|nr:adenylyltransferase/cytidyltransferase family protein [Clostridia bacterium]